MGNSCVMLSSDVFLYFGNSFGFNCYYRQANLNRHWEEIITEAKVLVTSTVRTALLWKIHSRTPVDCGNLDPGLLYSQWESFIKPCITGKIDVSSVTVKPLDDCSLCFAFNPVVSF